MTKIKPFINRYYWEGINFPSEKDDFKKIQKANPRIALDVFYDKKRKKIYPAYISKHYEKWLELWKTSYSFNGFIKRMALYCSKKINWIIKKNNVKIQR